MLSKVLAGVVGLLGVASMAFAGEIIPADEALAKAVGKDTTIEGTVVEVKSSRGGNVFLNFERKYPANTFSAVVLVRKGGAPLLREGNGWLRKLQGQRIRVYGPVTEYQGRAQIQLIDRIQIQTTESEKPSPIAR